LQGLLANFENLHLTTCKLQVFMRECNRGGGRVREINIKNVNGACIVILMKFTDNQITSGLNCTFPTLCEKSTKFQNSHQVLDISRSKKNSINQSMVSRHCRYSPTSLSAPNLTILSPPVSLPLSPTLLLVQFLNNQWTLSHPPSPVFILAKLLISLLILYLPLSPT
jgi:hypothetical protein